MVTAHLRLAKGGHAEVVRVNGDQIELRMTISAPPGAPVDAVLDQEPKVSVKIKSHGSKRDMNAGDDSAPEFMLTGRLVSATRELRDRLTALIGTAASSPSTSDEQPV